MRKKTILLLLLLCACATAPRVPKNRYGLEVVSDLATYERLAQIDPTKRLVDVATAVPGIAIDVRYATTNNFMHERLYPVARVLVRAPVARALAQVEVELGRQGLGLKIFDGYRPYRVTERMWEPYKNPDFVADPAKGSRHNRGAAVDLTLIDLRSGAELLMPTPYDDFSPKAHHDFADLPADVLANRAKLRDVMTSNGFEPLPSEWWHYDFRGWQRFELMDIGLDELSRPRS
ncbi:MAG TPA: M15 family metallopeptidase [Thermoanaerobaculia bacterium]|nr:M15 family metallopeptidase [Thermoanaerobaculia bacterium]